MKNTKQQPQTGSKRKNQGVNRSSVDRKNDAASGGYTAATKRVKPKSGDGLSNEGSTTSYEGER